MNPPLRPNSGARYTLLDPLRILASFGVVWHHTREGWFLGVAFGLFLFFVMMLALVSASTREESLLALARRRAGGLLGPWLRWSCVYFLLHAVLDVALGDEPLLARYRHGHLFAGARFHLWFLPFALGALVAARAAVRAFPRWPLGARVGFFTCFAFLGATWAATMNARYWMPAPYLCWVGAWPSIPLGVAFGLALRAPSIRARRRLLAVIVAVGAVSAAASPLWAGGHDEVRRYLAATALASVGFAFTPRVPAVVTRLAATTFGIYLVHPLVVDFLAAVTEPAAWPATVHVVVVWGLSALVIAALARLPFEWAETARLRAGRRAATPAPEAPGSRAALS